MVIQVCIFVSFLFILYVPYFCVHMYLKN